MKKLLALVLAMLLLCTVAMADVLDFGDFNMDLDPNWPGTVNEKVSGQMFVTFFPNYDEASSTHPNINVVWQEDVEDVAAIDPTEFANAVLSQYAGAFAAQGLEVTNLNLLGADHDEHNGVPALSIVISLDCDYSGQGLDLQATLYIAQTMISQPGVGSYVFTATAASFEELATLVDILNTLSWNF